MECKECKITCDGKELATMDCKQDGIQIKWDKDCKDTCKGFFKGCC
jgi:hypothetical protein